MAVLCNRPSRKTSSCSSRMFHTVAYFFLMLWCSVVKVLVKFRPDSILSLLTLIRCENKFELINVNLDDGVTGVFAAGVQQPELLPWFQTHAINGPEFGKILNVKESQQVVKTNKSIRFNTWAQLGDAITRFQLSPLVSSTCWCIVSRSSRVYKNNNGPV